jgi:hypothetical protein
MSSENVGGEVNMSGDSENSNELEFRYESNEASSFLVVGCRARILEFQAKMLENNSIRYIVPIEMIKAEGICYFYYNITSRISLLMYLKRYKLSRMEFLKLLLNLTSCIINSAGYLLSASNFVFDPEYVFIEPDTMEARLIYIPAEAESHREWTFQALVSDVLMRHINEAGFEGNLVQRILSEVNSEVFNLRSFMILINDLLYGEEADVMSVRPSEHDPCNKITENYCKREKIEEKQENRENKKSKTKNISLSLVLPAVLLQFAMGGIIFLCRGFLDNIGENRTTTYMAVMMIVAAVDVLIFRKLQVLKLFRANSADRGQESTQIDVPENKDEKVYAISTARAYDQERIAAARPSSGMEASAARAYERLKRLTESTVKEKEPDTDTEDTDRTDEVVRDDITSRYMQKTEILGGHTKKVHMLKSKGRFESDRDIVIDRDEIIIGRLQGHVDHVLFNNAVGRLHAELILRDGSCFVKDLNSVNGTFVNDIRIESNKEVELKNNDSLQFANSEYVYICSQP